MNHMTTMHPHNRLAENLPEQPTPSNPVTHAEGQPGHRGLVALLLKDGETILIDWSTWALLRSLGIPRERLFMQASSQTEGRPQPAIRGVEGSHPIMLARLVSGAQPWESVLFLNRDRTDCRASNLQPVMRDALLTPAPELAS